MAAYYIDALINPGTKWGNSNVGSPATVSFSFLSSLPSYYSSSDEESNNFVPFNAAQKSAARTILSLYSEIANINFVEVSGVGDLTFGTGNFGVDEGAHAYYPSSSSYGGDVWFNNYYAYNLTPNSNNYAYTTLIHEIGHALGMKHPGNYNAGGGGTVGPYLPTSEDSEQFTVMSYYDSNYNYGTHPSSPQLYDIAAMQYLYGANTRTRTGNDTYTFSTTTQVKTIWDAGGIDTINASNQFNSVTINLSSGTFSSIGGTNNIAIAYNCQIENAVGGAGNDYIYGNSLVNVLDGSGGYSDYLDGGLGNDILYSTSNKSDSLNGNSGFDQAIMRAGRSSFSAGTFNPFAANGSIGSNYLSSVEAVAFTEVQHGGSFITGQAQYADLNADGKADLIMQGNDNSFWVSLSSGNAFTSPQKWMQHGGGFLAGQAQYADLNGDGKKDLIMQGNDNRFWVSLSTGSSFGSPQAWMQHGGGFAAGQAQYADLNGDGKKDLIMQGNDNRFWVSLSTGSSFGSPQAWMQHGGGFAAGQAQYADLNGDGKDDLIMQGNDNRFWVSLSTGSSFGSPQAWMQHGGGFVAGQAQYADLNGDGKKDLIMQGNDNRFWVSLSTGSGFSSPQAWMQHGGGFVAGQAQYADLNGDGKKDLIMQGNDNQIWESISLGTGFSSTQQVAHFEGSFAQGQLFAVDASGGNGADLLMQSANNQFLMSVASTDFRA
ncbi:MAG: hypothetical protein DCF19_15775 [Pseudanabaena frigida]|uniref:Peptidase metallopeptidase domain-containing protein n=1 Tax=Pseudanabaena frigida TaxID=945775 RepID=A0A2W4W9P2_9CYAN|nr:MAG: hypothetical protein DCF19_15775 [Pseudanabaena frigida]